MTNRHPERSHDNARALARRVRTLREARGWSRARLAAEAGVAGEVVGWLESEASVRPGFPSVRAVAEALGVSVGVLLGEADA